MDSRRRTPRASFTATSSPPTSGSRPTARSRSSTSVSDEGTLAYLPGTLEASGSSPVWVGLDGAVEPMPIPPENYSGPRISPDGSHFLLARRLRSQSLWIAESDRGFIGPVTNDDGNDYWSVWSPDGKHVIYNSQLGIVPANVWIQSVDGRGQPTRLTTAEAHHPPADITGDGRTVLIGSGLRPGEDLDILLLRMGDEPTTEPLLSSDADETHPALSPDERWIAYASDVTGTFEVYAERFPDLGEKVRISASGGQEPRWSPSGDRLYYRSTDGRKVFGIDVTGGDIIRFGPESLLFQGSFSPGPRWGANWDIHPDGDRFLMLQLERPDNPREIRVVTNWFAELERLVPTSD